MLAVAAFASETRFGLVVTSHQRGGNLVTATHGSCFRGLSVTATSYRPEAQNVNVLETAGFAVPDDHFHARFIASVVEQQLRDKQGVDRREVHCGQPCRQGVGVTVATRNSRCMQHGGNRMNCAGALHFVTHSSRTLHMEMYTRFGAQLSECLFLTKAVERKKHSLRVQRGVPGNDIMLCRELLD